MMTAHDTARDVPATADRGEGRRLPAEPGAARKPRSMRRLPVQADWPAWTILVIQVGIVVAAIALWEVLATYGWIDAFFWSKPSAIAETMVKFFVAGDAWTDIG